MLGPYHRGDTVHVHLWDGERFIPAGTYHVTDERCAPPREQPKGWNVYQTTYESR